jgi:hypothetical protein
MEDKQLQLTQPRFRDLSLAEIQNVSKALFASGIFTDTRSQAVAFAKILAGQEFGLGPFAAMQEISFINGKPNLSATAKAAKIKESTKYDYRVVELDNKHCKLEFTQHDKVIGTVVYDEEMAKTGGEYSRNANYKTHPDDMYFAGALRKGQRRYAPDALNGIATYDREEFVEAEVVEPGFSTNRVKVEEMPPVPEPSGKATDFSNESYQNFTSEPTQPEPEPERVRPMQLRKIMAILKDKGITDAEQQKALIYHLGGVQSRTELTVEMADAIIDVLNEHTPEELIDMITPEAADESSQ